MNELSNTAGTIVKVRRSLLATASTLVLVACVSLPEAQAADESRPTVWIEGGWHFEGVTGESDIFVPPLDASTKAIGLPSLTTIENSMGRTYGAEASISFQPKGSEWVFAVSGRYGRVQTTRHAQGQATIYGEQLLHEVTAPGGVGQVAAPFTPHNGVYSIGYSSNTEAHAIVDFQVGKDVGVGLLGRGTDSIISFGARYAQMNAKSKGHSYAKNDATFEQITSFGKYFVSSKFNRSAAFVDRANSLHALGPSISLKNTTGLLGTADDGQLALDWGVNAALLFGRQKAKTSHHSTVKNYRGFGPIVYHVYPPVTNSRSRMVTVPNIGGFAGLSYKFPNAKISAGYRADFFFGARDSGLDTRSSADIGFHGPYATISVGLP